MAARGSETADPVEAARFRGLALRWLRAVLQALGGVSEGRRAGKLLHWRHDKDLAGVRDRLEDLPEPERDGWRRLWADVDAALAK
jgi:hypothetical protein